MTITSDSYSKTLTVTPPAGSGTTVPLTITGISSTADSFTITAGRNTTGSPGGWTMFSEVQFFGTGAKANNTDALNLATAWTGSRAPVSTDVVLFNTTFTSATALNTGAAVDWAGLKVTGGSSTLTIDPSPATDRLGIGSSGIDLSAASRDVRLTDLRLTGSAAQPWSIASGRSLTIGADSLGQDAGANPTLSGAGSLVKEGASTGLTLGSLASFTGTLDLQAGSVATSLANQLSNNYTVNLAAAGTLQLGGNDALPTSMNTGAGTVEILQSNVLMITNATDRTVSRTFSGTGSITKTGTGTLTVSGSNSYSGGTLISGGPGTNGTLQLGSNTALGTGTVTIGGANFNQGSTLDVNGTTISNTIVIPSLGSGVNDAGALQNTNTTTAAVVDGTVQIGGTNYVGGAGDIAFNGVVSGGVNTNFSFFKQGAGTWTFANPANTFDGFYYQIGGVTEVTKLANAGETSSLGQPSVSQNSVSFGFNAAGGGTLRYIGSAASTSDRAFSLRGLTAAASNAIEADGTSSAATLTLTGGLSAGAAGSYTARLGGSNAGVNEYAGVITNGSGTVGLEKAGGTTWVLSGANTYTGPTSIVAGRLSVNNSLASTAVTVANTATLGGSGTISGSVAVQSGGTLAPGNSIESLAAGATTFASGATFAYEVDSTNLGSLGTAADLLVVSGSLSIASGTLLTFTDLNNTPQPFVEDTTIFAMINYTGTWDGGVFTYNSQPLADGSRFSVGSQIWEIDYNRTSAAGLDNFTADYLPSSSFVTVMAVPEPSTLGLAAAAAGLAAILRHRRALQARQTA